jgi:hypothetical protein
MVTFHPFIICPIFYQISVILVTTIGIMLQLLLMSRAWNFYNLHWLLQSTDNVKQAAYYSAVLVWAFIIASKVNISSCGSC